MQQPPPRRGRRVFYGWWIVVAGFGANFCSGGLFFHSFGVYLVALEQQFGWSKSLLSGAFGLARIEGGLLGPITGFLIDRLGPRRVMFMGFVLFGLGFVLASRINSPQGFYLSFLVIALGSSLSGFLVTTTAINNWFRRHRATAFGIATAGMGVAGIFVPAVAWGLTTYGWRDTILGIGVFIWVVGIPLSRLMRHAPEAYGYLPDGDVPEALPRAHASPQQAPTPTTPTEDFTARVALRTRAFWFLALGHALALVVISAITVHQVAFMEQELGFSRVLAANVVTVLTLATIAGQLLAGVVGGWMDKRFTIAACMVGHSVALLLLVTAQGLPQVMAFAVIQGLAWGVRGVLINVIRGDYFGRKAFATITGYNNLITSVGNVLGPVTAGIVADVYGSYNLAFYTLAAATAAGSLLFLTVRKPTLPEAPGATTS